jgi:hypothetical protein
LAAVEKVGGYCVTFQDWCKNIIMQTSTSSVWDDKRYDLWFIYTLLGFGSLQGVVGMTDGGSNPSGARDCLHHPHSCWPRGPSSLLHIESLVSFLGINWLCVAWPPHSPSIAKVKNYYRCISSPPLYQWWYICLDLVPYLTWLAPQECYIVWCWNEKPQWCNTSDTLLKVLSLINEDTKQ